MKFGGALLAVTLLAAQAAIAEPFPADREQKVLRYAFERAETTLDPQKTSDIYSNFIESAIIETPLDYDYLARPVKLVPLTLASMPEISADGKTYTLRVKPGIYFTDDPAFKGARRELVAEDYVYSLKRVMDPKLSAPLLAEIEGVIAGSEQAIERARKSGRFDYDAPIEGLKALDRYTFQIKLNDPFYNFIYNLADCRASCAVAREVVEYYGDDIGSHPVGTGPYKLAFWKRSSRIVLEANPDFREEYFERHCDRRRGARDPRAAEGQAPADDRRASRSRSSRRSSRAGFRSSTTRWTSSSACPRNSPTSACRTTSSRQTSRGAASRCARRRDWTSPTRTSTWTTR